jgi:xanthine dehydrogenase iron-sulfur cluster and FAD-binding subunit A
MSNVVSFNLNGQQVNVPNADPLMTLNEYLRTSGLTGTKKVIVLFI